ncbi:hypothetical protein RCL1_004351 [Eukaryota sp. TZLM3-RCL]
MSSNLILVGGPEGIQYHKNNIDRSLSKEEISLLTSLKHPNLIGYYHTEEQETNKIISDYCEFGLFSDLAVSKQELDGHDLWSIRNQILRALKYLASQGLYHKGLNVSNVLVCSVNPFCIKLSLFSNSRLLIGSVNFEIPIQEFWKQKMNEQEEVCFDDLIQSIVKSVFPYSIIDKNVIFTNPNTLERNDLESIKALICSIESESELTPSRDGTILTNTFKESLFTINDTIEEESTDTDESVQFYGNEEAFDTDGTSASENLEEFDSEEYELEEYELLVSNTIVRDSFPNFPLQKRKEIYFSTVVLYLVALQSIIRFEQPLMTFSFYTGSLQCRNRRFSRFATKLISVSCNFRNVFFRAFDAVCGSRGHSLVIGDADDQSDSNLSSQCFTVSHLSNSSVLSLNLFSKFPITAITTRTLNFDTRIIDIEKITKLELQGYNQDLTSITLFPNLSCFRLSGSIIVHNFSVLSHCRILNSLTIESCRISDLAHVVFLDQLTSLILFNVTIIGFGPLPTSARGPRSLVLNDCSFADFSILVPLNSVTDLSLVMNDVIDLSTLPSLSNLRGLSLFCNITTDISHLSTLQFLKRLELSCQNITNIYPLCLLEMLVHLSLDNCKVTDITPLSSLNQLRNLSLKNTDVFDLWPLKNLTKLSTLDVRETLLPRNRQKLLTNSSEIKTLINSFQHGVCRLDFSNFNCTVNLSLYSHCSSLKSLKLSYKSVENIYEISKFTNLETLDLSNVKLPGNYKITDISFLSSCMKLKSLSLDGSQVTDLSPLSFLFELKCLSLLYTGVLDLWPLKNLTKLSTLDVRGTLLPRHLQRKLNDSYAVKALINSFEHGVFDFDFSNYNDIVNLSFYSQFPSLKSLILPHNRVENIVEISKFTNLETLDLSNVKLPGNYNITDISFLSTCVKLKSLSLDGSKVTDLSPLSLLVKLKFLSLESSTGFDLWPLKSLIKLSTLDVRETLLPRENQRKLNDSYAIKALINSFEHGVDLDLSNYVFTVNLSFYSHCSRLKSLNLPRKKVENISEISKFPNLETLDLSNVKLPGNYKITDISFLFSCIKLKSLSLEGSEVTDLSPLSLLVDLESLSLKGTKVLDLWPLKDLTTLSTLDLRRTLLPREHQRKLNDSYAIKALINSFEHGVDLDFSYYNDTVNLSFYSHCLRLKSLNLPRKRVDNVDEISKFTNLETVNLSHAKLGYTNSGQSIRISNISFLSSCIKLKSLSLDCSDVIDLSPLSLLSNNLKSLSLNNTFFSNICQVSLFKQLEFLSLNCTSITDISPLSLLENLINLSLRKTKVSDLSPLQNLRQLSFLEVRKTLLPQEFQRKVSGLSNVQEFLNSFPVQLVYSSINHSSRKRTCSSELSLKRVNKGNMCALM